MATWKELRNHIRSNYKLVDDSAEDIVSMAFNLKDRSQLIFVGLEEDPAGGQWAQISTVVGELPQVDLKAACHAAARMGIGGIILREGMNQVFLSHSLPLENVDINEFEDPVNILCIAGDIMEREFTGKDTY